MWAIEQNNFTCSVVCFVRCSTNSSARPTVKSTWMNEWMSEPACQTYSINVFDFLYTLFQIPELNIVHALLAAKVFHDDCKFSIKYMICSFRLTECNHYLDHHHHPYGNDIGLSRWHRMQMSICFSSSSFFLVFFFFPSVFFVSLIVSDEYAFSSVIAELPERDSGNERTMQRERDKETKRKQKHI